MQNAFPASNEQNAKFMQLLVQHQRRIHAFIVTLLPNLADAEDVLQETSLTAWQKFAEFQPGTDFVRWACTIAKLKVLKYRRERKPGRLIFSEELLNDLADRQLKKNDASDGWNQAFGDCLAKLRAEDRGLFLCCSRSDTTVKQVAAKLGRPVNTVYKAVNRIRKSLVSCVQRAVSREDHAR